MSDSDTTHIANGSVLPLEEVVERLLESPSAAEFSRALAQLEDAYGFTTLDRFISQIADAGLRVNNLFQLQNGQWQANVMRPPEFYEYGTGSTPEDAIETAIHNAHVVQTYSHMVARHKVRR